MKPVVRLVALSCAAILVSGAVGQGQGQGRGQGRMRRAKQPVPNQYIVVLNAGEDPGQVGFEAAAVHRGRALHTYRRALNGFAVQMSSDAAERLAEDPRVRFVEEDSVISLAQVQNSPPAGLDRIDQRGLPLDNIYEYSEVGSSVRVHIVDTGIRASHQEFGGRAVIAGDYVDDDGDGDPSDVGNDDTDRSTPDGADCNGHGTHVAGTIGGATYGVAKNVALHAYRVLNCGGSGTVSGALAAIDAISNDSYRPAVVNMSLGSEASPAFDSAVRTAIASGLTFVVAAGNSLSDASNFSPARVAEALTVGATDLTDVRAWFSNYGSSVDVFAPGVAVLSAWYTGDTDAALLSGTSMASPHVAGVAALHLSRDPSLTPQQVHDRLVTAATPNLVVNPGSGSPNRLLYSNLSHLTAPAVQLLSPGANERILSGRPYSIQWTASDPDGLASFDVFLSTDGGATYAPLVGCSGVDGAQRACAWTSPAPDTNTARIRVVARDLTGDSAYDQSSGNFSIVTKADLVTSDVTHSATRLSPGTSFAATDTVRNIGNTGSGPSTTRYYLSLDATRSSGDVQLTGSRAIPALAPDADSIGTETLTIPSTVSEGTYSLLSCADTSGMVSELDETNNCSAAPAQIAIEYPNLVTISISAPSSAAPSASFSVNDTVQNNRDVTASASKVRYYLSADPAKDAGDLLLNGTRSVPALAGGGTSAGSQNVTIPANAVAGTYRLLACADDMLVVRETDEGDNCAAAPGAVLVERPDLLTVAVSHQPAAAAPGTSITITESLTNTSSVTSTFSTTRYYLSADAQKSADDIRLGSSRYVASVAAGATSTGSRSMTLPVTVAHGDYRVLACADDMLTVDESDESNNCAASPTSLLVTLPDLVTTAISNPPATAAPGSTFSVTDTVQNSSPVGVGYTTTRYYLSADQVKNTGDILVTTVRSLLPLAASAASTGSRVLTVPAATPDGTYRVLACADDTSSVNETDESNNCAASATTMMVTDPDLVTTSVSNPPASAAPASTLTVTDTVQNASPVAAGYSTARYYLSADLVRSPDDVVVTAVRSVLNLAAGATSTGSRIITIPANTPLGTYRLIACADDAQQVNESDESNNCLASSTAMVVALPDLVMTSISDPPATVAANATFSVTETVRNIGDAGTSGWSTVRYYLSADGTLDAGDLLLSAFRSISAIGPGGTSTGTRTLQMPASLGTYFVIACADAGGAVTEADESNNCIVSATAVEIR